MRCSEGTQFPYNLRFPGQYYDAETGLNQNWNRDYDPIVGRYVESDPIGLQGGINTYSYARGTPVLRSDPSGQDVLVGYGGYRGGDNPFGHAWLAVTGAGLYSFGTGNNCGDSVREFLRQQALVRNQTLFFIKTSPAQDAQILKYLQQLGTCKNVGYVDNCAARTEGALQAGGIPLYDPADDFGQVSPFPRSLVQAMLILQAVGGASGVQIPQGSVPTIDVSPFERPH